MKRVIHNAISLVALAGLISAGFVAGVGYTLDNIEPVVVRKPLHFNKNPKVKLPPVKYVPGHEKNNDFLVGSA